jgi:TP901 family phage tail tape measure protein
MAKQIKREDLVEKDLFLDVRDSAEKTITTLKGLNEEFIRLAGVTKQAVKNAKFDSIKSINEFQKATEKATKLSQQQVKVELEMQKALTQKAKAEENLQRIETQRLKTAQEQIKLSTLESKEKERQKKENEKLLKQWEAETNAYKKLEKNTRDLKNESKRLGAEMLLLEQSGKKSSKEYGVLSKKFNEVTKQAQAGDKALKKLDNTVGDNFRNVGNYEKAVNGLKRGLGQLGLAFGIGSIVRDAGKVIIDFEQNIQDLKAITGAGGKDLEYYKDQAIQLGKGVEGGASAVVEAYKLIGSAKPELLENAKALNEVTESAIKLSQASGMTLPDSAKALTDAMNQFGASSDEAGKFIDVLANGSKFGSAEIPQITDALLKFGAVAKTSNVSIEESTALIEALAEKGLKGAEAGTGLRNVMLKLSAPDALPKQAKTELDKLGISFDKLKDKSLPFNERLKELKPLLNNSKALIKTFGTENAVVATNLISSSTRIDELNKKMYINGTATQQAEERTATLGHALIELKNSFDGLFLEVAKGGGALDVAVKGIKLIAENLPTIVSWLGKLVIGYGAYRTMLVAVNIQQKIKNGTLKDSLKTIVQSITKTKDLTKETKDNAEASESAGKGAKALGTALKSIGFAIAIDLAIKLVTALYDIASGSAQAREDMERLQKTSDNALKSVTKNVDQIKKSQTKTIAELSRELKKGTITQEEYNKKVKDANKLTNEQLKQNKANVVARKNQYSEDLKRLQLLEKEYKAEKDRGVQAQKLVKLGDEAGKLAKKYNIEGDASWLTFLTGEKDSASYVDVIAQLKANIQGTNVKIKEYGKTIEDNTEVVKDNEAEIIADTNATKENTKSKEKNKTEFKDLNDYVSEQIVLLKELNDIQNNRQVIAQQTLIDEEFQKQLTSAEQLGEAQVDLMEDLMTKKTDIQKENIKEQLNFTIKSIEDEFKLKIDQKQKELELERDTLLAQKNLTTNEKIQINENYKEKQKELDQFIIEAEKDKNLKIKIETEKSKDEVLNIENEKNDMLIDYNDQINDALDQNAKTKNDKIKEENKKELDLTKKQQESIQGIIKMTTDYFIKQSNKKIDQTEKELDALKKQESFLQELAVNGNITAEKSLVQNQKLQAEANKKKEQELKKQEKIKLAQSVFEAYSKNSADKTIANPVTKTITDIQVLNAFINSLPAFYEGTETTVSEALGNPFLSGKDGHIVRVDGQEKILNPKLSKMTGNLTTNEIAQISEDMLRGKLIYKGDKSVNVSSSFEVTEIVNKLTDLHNVILNKPETNIKLGEIVGGVMHVVEEIKTPGKTVRNISRFNA